MLGGRFGRRGGDEELQVEINMVPVMNMFLVLIPFLLMSSNFLPFFVINTSVPVTAPPSQSPVDPEEKPEIKVTMVLKLKEDGFYLEGMAEDVSEEVLNSFTKKIPLSRKGAEDQSIFYQLKRFLESIKERYPKSDTLILMPSEKTLYETIIEAMDSARMMGNDPLFPNVVISNEVESD